MINHYSADAAGLVKPAFDGQELGECRRVCLGALVAFTGHGEILLSLVWR